MIVGLRTTSWPTSPHGRRRSCSSTIHSSLPRGSRRRRSLGRAPIWSGGKYDTRLHSVRPYIGEHLRAGKPLAQRAEVRDRQRRQALVTMRIGADRRAIGVARGGSSASRTASPGHAGKHGDAPGGDELDQARRVRRRGCAGEHEPRAGSRRDRHDQLVEAVAERERQHAEEDVVARDAEVRHHRGRRGAHAAVRVHHALGLAGRAGRIDDRREIVVVRAMFDRSVPARAGRDRRHAQHGRGRDRRGGAAVGHDGGEPVGGDLRVRHHDHGARLEHGPQRDRGRRRVVAEHDHAIAGHHTPRDERAREAPGALRERAVRGAPVAADERDARGIAVGRDVQVVVNEHGRRRLQRALHTCRRPRAATGLWPPGARPCTRDTASRRDVV